MTDRATPNLPSRSFDATESFYRPLGFQRIYRENGWMILERGAIWLEFFAYPDLDPLASSFGSCLRFDDLDEFLATAAQAGLPTEGQPRLTRPAREASGLVIAYLVDPDGSLLRLIQNPD